MNGPQREIRRVRHEAKQRRLIVDRLTAITPKMLRVTLAGAELAGFMSLGFDDHIKLFFPNETKSESESTDRPPMRDYTPRYDPDAGVLHIDFAIHDAGPATDWALRRALIDERGANRAWVKAAGYWKRGVSAVHDTIED
jgi:NADPH-dependent ferric siderophore reductase